MSMRTSIIGGDSAHRGLFGGRISKPRLWALGSSVALTLVLVFIMGLWALLVGVVLIGAAWFATIDTANNTILQRRLKAARWKERLRRGTTKFVPFDQDGWDMLTDRWAEASTREEKRESMQELHAMRDTPDGVSGMLWLQDGIGEPGIQWHQTPEGEEYLAVTFTTTGQVTGIETDQVFDVASAGFSAVVASLGDPLGFAKRIQTISRNMPTDSAQHEAWMAENGDSSVPAVLLHSYKDVVDGVAAGQLMQRPMFTVSWPVSDRFVRRAARHGEAALGWRLFMANEIEGMRRMLVGAGYKNVHAMSARQTAAVIRHMQHPGFPMEQVADVTPTTGWLPSEDAWSYTTYVGAPKGGQVSVSLSRTARITAKNLEVVERNALWMAPLLGGMQSQVVRTIAWHIEGSPQDEARHLSEQDRVSDIADQIKRSKDGQIEDVALNVEADAARRRHQDLIPGTGHVGANWVGYITVTDGTERGLADVSELIEDAASRAGIRTLEWLEVDSATANAFTWPVGRGIAPANVSIGSKVEQFAQGKEAKEAL
jgi:hypothetical protein